VLSDLLYGWRGDFKGFNVFYYITVRAAFAALGAFVLCWLLMPRWIEWFRRRGLGQVVRADGPQSHRPKAGTPTMGGLVALAAAVASVLLWARPGSEPVWVCFAGLAWFGAVGLADDWLKLRHQHSRGLRPAAKLFWQTLGATGIGLAVLALEPAGGGRAPFFSVPFWKHPVEVGAMIYLVIVAFVLVGTTNAVNLTDGLDGLAAGCIGLAAGGLAVVAYLAGNAKFSGYLRIPHVAEAGELAVVCAAIVGACLGFLWYNAPPAQVFMGDVGALGLGGALGTVAVLIKAEVLLVIFGAVFVLEALSVLAQVGYYKLRRKRILLMAPLHHHFELRGVPESKVVVRFWIFSVLLIIAMLMTLKLR
jgi:phospho-N-acetylmuramoyl-pentapeptide-transferase